MKIVETPYFHLKELADGVYAAIAKPGTGAFSNAGFIDLGDGVIVFDALSTPAAAMALREFAEELTGKPVKYLFNSHWHGDHTFGNQIFSDVPIISTTLTRDFHKINNVLEDPQKEYEENKAYLEDLQSQIENESDPVHLESLKHQHAEMVCVTEAIFDLKITLPNLIFEDHLTIYGSKRTVELHCYGGGHTPSDAFLYIPDENIAFMGDLLTINMHPPIHDPYAFAANHKKILNFDIETYVPGHGDISSRKDLIILKNYMHHLIHLAEEAVQSDIPLEEFIKNGVSAEYAKWRGVGGPSINLTAAYEAAKQKHSLESA